MKALIHKNDRKSSELKSVQANPAQEAATGGATQSGHLKISGLSFGYPTSDFYTIKSLNLDIQPGEALSLLGPSGCGKSTLLHLMAGLLHPQSGSVSLDGQAITKPSPTCNLMLQQATLYPWLNVMQNAAFGLKINGSSTRDIKKSVLPLLKLVKLDHLAKRNVRKLSGGQQQRVALARSLATNPSVMLLDEPFSALDSFTRIELQNEIRDICKRRGITLVIVTHDFDEAIRMSDRILMMTNQVSGDIVAEIPNQSTFSAGCSAEAIAFQRARLTTLWEDHINQN